jgi:DNA-binding NtrC family response regulator
VKAVLRDSGLDQIEVDLPAVSARSALPVATADLRPLPEQIAELEARAITAALARTGGNRTAAARLLGISRASLYDKLSGVMGIV